MGPIFFSILALTFAGMLSIGRMRKLRSYLRSLAKNNRPRDLSMRLSSPTRARIRNFSGSLPPLTEAQIAYAALDAEVLLELAPRLLVRPAID
jgi:hypothetical protein